MITEKTSKLPNTNGLQQYEDNIRGCNMTTEKDKNYKILTAYNNMKII
jgi:lipopolysaccharide export system protein LptA